MDNQFNENNNTFGGQNPDSTNTQNQESNTSNYEQQKADSNQDTTYHRNYSSQPDPNARTYVNPQAGSSYERTNTYSQQTTNESGTPRYATFNTSGNYQSQNQTDSFAGSSNYYNGNRAASYQNRPQTSKIKKDHKTLKFVGKAAAFGLIAGTIMVGMAFGYNHLSGNKNNNAVTTSTAGTVKTTSSTSSSNSKGTVSSLVENVMPSIVSITSTFQSNNNSDFNNFYYWFYGGNNSSSPEQTGSGSGVVISETDDELMIVTNNHVISDTSYGDAKKVQVTFNNDKTVDAVVKGKDSDADLAVLTVKKSDLSEKELKEISVAVIGDSDQLNVGDNVVAIGNALGYGQSVTAGIVSALNREVELEDKTMTLLQTDAAINPGNSGGALLNMNGELIGINSVKYASDSVEGMGYAIPMKIAQPIIEELMNEKAVAKGDEAYLGIYGTDITSELAKSYTMPEGVYVKNITDNSPAESSGLQVHDIITKFNEHAITSMQGLQEQIAKKSAGTEVTLTIQRQSSNGQYEEKEIKVTLGKKSEASNSTENNPASKSDDANDDKNNSNDQDQQDRNSDQNGSPSSDDLWNYFFNN